MWRYVCFTYFKFELFTEFRWSNFFEPKVTIRNHPYSMLSEINWLNSRSSSHVKHFGNRQPIKIFVLNWMEMSTLWGSLSCLHKRRLWIKITVQFKMFKEIKQQNFFGSLTSLIATSQLIFISFYLSNETFISRC